MQEIRGISALDFELLVADITERVVTNFEKHLEKKTEEIVDLATEQATASASDDVERMVENALENGSSTRSHQLELTTDDLIKILSRAVSSPCAALNTLKSHLRVIAREEI